MAKKKRKQKKKKSWLTAKTADRHDLYEKSVQEPGAEVDLVNQVWREHRTRACRSIREDFCGTAAVCMEWVKEHPDNTAVGVDLDAEVLDWGRAKIPQRVSEEQASRITLYEEDVLTHKGEPVDSVLAMNFSYFLFFTREALRDYFKKVHAQLVDDGIFLLDAYGGSDSYLEMEEERHFDGFTYIWDQHYVNPITCRVVNFIHFTFPDGTKMREAFRYEWRMWSLPEIQELLLEAGFDKVAVYWEGTDEETGEGDGEWSISTRGEACQGWVAYLTAFKS
jgi:hypothetical protein